MSVPAPPTVPFHAPAGHTVTLFAGHRQDVIVVRCDCGLEVDWYSGDSVAEIQPHLDRQHAKGPVEL